MSQKAIFSKDAPKKVQAITEPKLGVTNADSLVARTSLLPVKESMTSTNNLDKNNTQTSKDHVKEAIKCPDRDRSSDHRSLFTYCSIY